VSFPALDPEPERRTVSGRLVVIVVGVLVVAGVAAVVVQATRGNGRQAAAPARQLVLHPPARLIAYAASGNLVLEDAGGSRRAVQPGIVDGSPVASSDGRYVLSGSGSDFFAVSATGLRRLAPLPTATNDTSEPGPPFADHDGYLLAPNEAFGDVPVELVPVHHGRDVFLGTADMAAGDPASLGAFVVVPSPHGSVPDPRDQQISVRPDVSVQLRRAGRPTRTLLTAARLDRMLGVATSTKVTIAVAPSPDGRFVLVEGAAITPVANDVDVVLRRNGTKVATTAPASFFASSWSAHDDTLAVIDNDEHELELGRPGAVPVVLRLPSVGVSWSGCDWSADDTWLACAGWGRSAQAPSRRLVVDVNRGLTQVTRTTDAPVAWMPEPAS
jgi:hypothetical protein